MLRASFRRELEDSLRKQASCAQWLFNKRIYTTQKAPTIKLSQ